jgi:hypothetical protein
MYIHPHISLNNKVAVAQAVPPPKSPIVPIILAISMGICFYKFKKIIK